jgi:hypothetical protein
MIQKLKLKWFVSKKTETETICETETKLKWFVGEKTETGTEMICRTEMMKSQFSFLMHCVVIKMIWVYQIHKKKQNNF